MIEWDDVYQDEVDESVEIRRYDHKEDLKKVTKAWNRRFLKNLRIPFIIAIIVSLTSIYFLEINNSFKDINFAFGIEGLFAKLIIFFIIFIVSMFLFLVIIEGLYHFSQKKSEVETTGNYQLEDQKDE
ncbi:MAG: hypothetical protein V5A64_01880 [Candidatus Thermoplasmatota archaeon]